MGDLFGNKLPDAKGFADDQVSKAKSFGEGNVCNAKGLGENKLNEAKGFGEGKLNDVKGFSNNFSTSGSVNFDNSKSPSLFGSDDNKAAGFSGDSPSAVNTENTAASPFASSVPQQKSAPFGSESKTGSSSSGGTAPSGSPAVAGTGADKKKSEPKTYIVKQDDDLGLIAKKFHLPSWKYLYQINKSKIGDNPDLLKVGTELTIPQWDSTKGDELIREKGADPFAYTGGLQYRYPWEPVSITLAKKDGSVYTEKDKNGKPQKNFEVKKKYEIRNSETGEVLASGEIGHSEEISVLVPAVKSRDLYIDGKKYVVWNGVEE
jgi:LysM repeat protein